MVDQGGEESMDRYSIVASGRQKPLDVEDAVVGINMPEI